MHFRPDVDFEAGSVIVLEGSGLEYRVTSALFYFNGAYAYWRMEIPNPLWIVSILSQSP